MNEINSEIRHVVNVEYIEQHDLKRDYVVAITQVFAVFNHLHKRNSPNQNKPLLT